MTENRLGLQAVLSQMEALNKEISEQTFYMHYAIDEENWERLEVLLEERAQNMMAYDDLKIQFNQLVEEITAENQVIIDKIEESFRLIYEEDQKLSIKMQQSYNGVKDSLRKIGASRQATKGYLNTTGLQGMNYKTHS